MAEASRTMIEASVCQIGDEWVYVCTHRNEVPASVGLFGSIDCSFSMDSKATLPESNESVSFIELTRCILSAVVDTMPAGSELRIGSFADEAREEFASTNLTDAERTQAKSKIQTLQTRGSTNLEAAIRIGFQKLASERRVVIVLTDGSPTVRPAEGEEAAIRKLIDGRTTVIIIAIANSELNLSLMHKVAVSTGGYLVYVNDATMGATCVINAAATIATLSDTNVCVSVDSKASANVIAPDCYMNKDGSVNLGLLMRGSHRDIVVTIPKASHPTPPTVQFSDNRGSVAVAQLTTDDSRITYAIGEYARSIACVNLAYAAENCDKARLKSEVSRKIIECANMLVKLSCIAKSEVIDALLEGFDGELSKAVEMDNISRWGGGALYAALSAHWNRICLNFRDPDMQMYQTDESSDIRIKAAASFVKPLTTTSNTTTTNVTPTQNAPMPPQMGNYYNNTGGCILPGAPIETVCGVVPIELLGAGAILRTGEVVRHVFRMPRYKRVAAVELAEGVLLTPFHPVRIDGSWIWPYMLNAITYKQCDAVYNVVLERGHSIWSGGIEIVTLGHELSGDRVGHAVYGSRRCVEEMARAAPLTQNQHRLLIA